MYERISLKTQRTEKNSTKGVFTKGMKSFDEYALYKRIVF